MNFDLGEVLTRAWQITWKHRVLWVFAMLPMLPFVLFLPLILYFFLSPDFQSRAPVFFEDPNLIILFFGGTLFLAAISFVLQIFSNSATTAGIFQVEAGKGRVSFPEIAQGGRAYFWRMLGAILLVSIGMMAFFAVFSACLSLIGLVTFGIGSMLGQLLFLPAAMAAYALLEQTQAAVVVDSLNPVDAITRAWELMQENITSYALITVILYFGLTIFSSIASVPLMAPLLLAVFNRFSGELSNSPMLWIGVLCFAAFVPVYFVLQAAALLFTKSAFMITYLRLTRSSKLQPLPLEATP